MTRHLDDEQLSAHLDGEVGEEEAAPVGEHLAWCGACRARLGELEAVVAVVGEPVALGDDTRREAAVTAAGAAWAAEREAPVAARQRRPAFPSWALGAAAAVAALLLAVSVLAAVRGDDSGDTTTALSPTVTAGRAETSGPARGVLDGGDLGEESDAQALARTVEDALEGGPARRGSASRPQSTRASPGQADSAAAPAAMEDVMACAEAARGLLGPDPGELVYTAAVRYQGTPAVVLAFRVAPAAQADGADEPRRAHRVVVMAREGCRPLVVQAL